ncbi:topoisomerase DNA-binding C4 zinc finger domain-containing protein [Variovorax sp. J22R115]|uniref:topoisomerase DNA-binding C4 zinc finger domain-containing protein n=1 Tax=Variovorax sp. J22R115 TaxID=3053509 RepID=UPI0034DF4FB8
MPVDWRTGTHGAGALRRRRARRGPARLRFLRLRKSTYGPFVGCSNFPRCRYTRDARRQSR